MSGNKRGREEEGDGEIERERPWPPSYMSTGSKPLPERPPGASDDWRCPVCFANIKAPWADGGTEAFRNHLEGSKHRRVLRGLYR